MFEEDEKCSRGEIERVQLRRGRPSVRGKSFTPLSLKRLRALNLRNNKRLTDRTIDAVLRFCEDTGSSCVLTDVNCSGGTFSAAIGRLGEALERNAVGYLRRRLKKEGVSNCNVTDGIFMRLFEDIVILKNAVDVRNNNITENGFKQFFEKFSVHCCEEENNGAVVFISLTIDVRWKSGVLIVLV